MYDAGGAWMLWYSHSHMFSGLQNSDDTIIDVVIADIIKVNIKDEIHKKEDVTTHSEKEQMLKDSNDIEIDFQDHDDLDDEIIQQGDINLLNLSDKTKISEQRNLDDKDNAMTGVIEAKKSTTPSQFGLNMLKDDKEFSILGLSKVENNSIKDPDNVAKERPTTDLLQTEDLETPVISQEEEVMSDDNQADTKSEYLTPTDLSQHTTISTNVDMTSKGKSDHESNVETGDPLMCAKGVRLERRALSSQSNGEEPVPFPIFGSYDDLTNNTHDTKPPWIKKRNKTLVVKHSQKGICQDLKWQKERKFEPIGTRITKKGMKSVGNFSNWKTQLCRNFVVGRCIRKNCTFAHGEHELRDIHPSLPSKGGI